MKALLVVSEDDPQGTVVGVEGFVEFPDDPFFRAILADRDRLIDLIAEKDQKIRELERALALKIEIMGARS